MVGKINILMLTIIWCSSVHPFPMISLREEPKVVRVGINFSKKFHKRTVTKTTIHSVIQYQYFLDLRLATNYAKVKAI